MSKSIIDTNVIKTADLANTDDNNIPLSCIEKCMDIIETIEKHGGLLIDSNWEIIKEYENNIRNPQFFSFRFLKWVLTHQANQKFVEMYCLGKTGEIYTDFPKDEELNNFDPADKKFIALANAYSGSSIVYEATDSEWWGYRDAFAKAQIEVCFLCEDYVKDKYNNKYNR